MKIHKVKAGILIDINAVLYSPNYPEIKYQLRHLSVGDIKTYAISVLEVPASTPTPKMGGGWEQESHGRYGNLIMTAVRGDDGELNFSTVSTIQEEDRGFILNALKEFDYEITIATVEARLMDIAG